MNYLGSIDNTISFNKQESNNSNAPKSIINSITLTNPNKKGSYSESNTKKFTSGLIIPRTKNSSTSCVSNPDVFSNENDTMFDPKTFVLNDYLEKLNANLCEYLKTLRGSKYALFF